MIHRSEKAISIFAMTRHWKNIWWLPQPQLDSRSLHCRFRCSISKTQVLVLFLCNLFTNLNSIIDALQYLPTSLDLKFPSSSTRTEITLPFKLALLKDYENFQNEMCIFGWLLTSICNFKPTQTSEKGISEVLLIKKFSWE